MYIALVVLLVGCFNTGGHMATVMAGTLDIHCNSTFRCKIAIADTSDIPTLDR